LTIDARAAGAPLLATKLYQPTPRDTAVVRPRLVARLLAGMRARLTLLAAPAGFGKSTLLAQAVAEGQKAKGKRQKEGGDGDELLPATLYPLPSQVAWVALDEGDNDAARFWSYVCMALERASAGLGAAPLAILRAAPSAIDAALAELLNTLAECAEQVVLVLDDYHVITNAAIHTALGFLLDHAPPQFHLLIASRIDPPLPLARWRARGELTEIRAADLRFSGDEAQQFLTETMGLGLDAEQAAALEARTEGWAAGLQLAALSLQGLSDVRGFIDTFSGSHRHVVDYLAEEVLGRQPEHIRMFLLQTSILERMCGPLCDAVLGMTTDDRRPTTDSSPSSAVGGERVRTDERRPTNDHNDGQSVVGGQWSVVDSYSQLILADLERQNLFLVPLDEQRRWYRYHHLFADLLRHRLAHEQPALVRELHRRAALWFEQHGAPADAVSHALAAADAELAARQLSAHAARFAANGETRTLQRWLDALPRDQLLGNPRLCLAQVQVLMLSRQIVPAEPYLEAAEAALARADEGAAVSLRGELLALRAHVAIERGAFADALALARRALVLLPPHEHWSRSSSTLVLGYALMVLGHTGEAVATHAENVALSRAAGNPVSGLFSATEVVKLRVLQGRLTEARASVDQALGWAADEGWRHLPPVSALHIWRGNVLIEQGDLPAAEAELATAIRLTRHGPAITDARAHVFLARLRQLQGDRAGASAALAEVEAICRGWQPSGERSFFEAHAARVRLMQGDVATAQRWAGERAGWDRDEAPSYFREIELLTLARVAVLGDAVENGGARVAEALARLGWLREQASAGGRGAVVIEARALEALGLARSGRPEAAHERLGEALALAAPEGLIGSFADLGAPMAGLLRQELARRAASDPIRPYVARLLEMCAAEPAPSAPRGAAEPAAQQDGDAVLLGAEALTEREVDVLRLYAAGMTSPEIADHFVVSINTVKTQLKSIYSKLGVHSRAAVVARARGLGIIP
jgi:LuxR family maltose regulon positive regulatory protein